MAVGAIGLAIAEEREKGTFAHRSVNGPALAPNCPAFKAPKRESDSDLPSSVLHEGDNE
jgi:hypothetical protein